MGTWEKPTWSDTVVAFSAFYHRLQKGAHISDAVQAMSVAAGCHFAVEWADDQKKKYLEFFNSRSPASFPISDPALDDQQDQACKAA